MKMAISDAAISQINSVRGNVNVLATDYLESINHYAFMRLNGT